jgi:hypothetical protein
LCNPFFIRRIAVEFLEKVQVVTQNDVPIWPYGADHESVSEEAARAWCVLTKAEMLAISRHNPFRNERNKAIYRLHKTGLTYRLLSELSGFSRRQIDIIMLKIRKENGPPSAP